LSKNLENIETAADGILFSTEKGIIPGKNRKINYFIGFKILAAGTLGYNNLMMETIHKL
jgi:hypothetical protein